AGHGGGEVADLAGAGSHLLAYRVELAVQGLAQRVEALDQAFGGGNDLLAQRHRSRAGAHLVQRGEEGVDAALDAAVLQAHHLLQLLEVRLGRRVVGRARGGVPHLLALVAVLEAGKRGDCHAAAGARRHQGALAGIARGVEVGGVARRHVHAGLGRKQAGEADVGDVHHGIRRFGQVPSPAADGSASWASNASAMPKERRRAMSKATRPAAWSSMAACSPPPSPSPKASAAWRMAWNIWAMNRPSNCTAASTMRASAEAAGAGGAPGASAAASAGGRGGGGT